MAGLGTVNYVSTASLISTTAFLVANGGVTTAQITSTVTGLATTGYISTSQLTSTIRGLGQIYLSTVVGGSFDGSTIRLSAALITVSTVSTNMIFANNINTNAVSTNALVFGSGTGTLLMPDIAPNTVYTSTVTSSNILVGWNAVQSPIQFYGFGTYSNSVIVEQSTGTTTQELLFFRGSNAADRMRFQTTGYFSIETGVSARLFPTTGSNAIPAFTIDVNSNVGIKVAAPATPLDVNGIARANTFSSMTLFTSSFTAITTSSIFITTSSILANVVGTQILGSNVSSFTTGASTFTGRWNDAVYYVLQTI